MLSQVCNIETQKKKKKKLTTLLDVNYFKIFLIFYKIFSYRSLEHYPYAGPLLV